MSSVSTIHTLVPNATIPLGYYDEDNIRFIQNKIKEVLKRVYIQDILIDRASIIRIMERVLLDRIEPVVKMNQRVIMTICNEYITYQLDVTRKLRAEENYWASQRLYDPIVEVSRYDSQNTKLANRLGWPKVGGTQRFYFV